MCPQVLDTLKVAAMLGRNSLGAYVISMATHASDVLAVELLQRETKYMVSGEADSIWKARLGWAHAGKARGGFERKRLKD